MEEININMFDEKDRIKQYIKDGIENETSLQEIKESILDELNKLSLDSIEEIYINHKYIKYCLNQWFEQLPLIFNEMTSNQVQNIRENVLQIKTLEEIPSLFSDDKYFQLIIKNLHLLVKIDCDLILVEFKQSFIDYFKQNFIDYFKQNSDVIQQKDLLLKIEKEVTNFFSIYEIHTYAEANEIRLKTFINTRLEGLSIIQFINLAKTSTDRAKYISESFKKLKDALRSLQTINETNLTDFYLVQVKKMFVYNLTPVTFEVKKKETRNILIAKGVYISLRRILSELERQLIQSESVELCLSVAETLFIDCDLENRMWHGNNIAIRAKRIVIIEKRTIDISGLNGEPQEKPTKGENGRQGSSENDKNGQHGRDGAKGESGGNVLIVTQLIENAQSCTIKSNGGDGSYGQDGGDGADGENGQDGHGLTLEEFKKQFPPAARFLSPQAIECKTKTFDYIKTIAKNHFTAKTWDKNLYIEGETEYGNKITFSYYYSATTREAYCLYEGTSGQPGKPGGFAGLGGYQGEPGFAGNIQILTRSNTATNMNTIALDGYQKSDGEPGRDGKYGKSGENKPDVGYMDYKWWDPIYYGPSWLRLSTYDSSAKDRLRNANFQNEEKYSVIENRQKPDSPTCLSFNAEAKQRHKNAKQKKQEATRKHDISNELLTEVYNDHQRQFGMNSIESLQVNFDLYREQISRAHIEEIEIKKENISITQPFIQGKHFKLNHKLIKFQSNQLILSDSVDELQKLLNECHKLHDKDDKRIQYVQQIANDLKCNTYNYEDTLNLLSIVENNQSTWEKIKSQLKEPNNNESEKLKPLLIEKVKLSLLKKIAQIIENNPINIMDEFIEEETHRRTNSAIHSTLGIKNEFGIYECIDCERIRNNIKENIIKIVNDNTEISELIYQSMIKLLFINENKEKFPLMKNYVENFSKRISRNNLESNKLNQTADNSTHRFDNNLLTEYGNCICENEQAFNKYDIALLAYFHNICLNVHMFSPNDPSLLRLFSTYNKNCRNVQHVLYLNNQFVKLSVRKNENQNSKCFHYNQILNDVKDLKTSDEFKEYFNNKHYEFHGKHNEISDQIEETKIDEIIDHFGTNTSKCIKLALKMISPKFLSNFNLLKSLNNRFTVEKVFVNSETIILLSMSIIDSYANKENLTIYKWIINAYPQNEWINELALTKFEQFTNEPYKKIPYWRSLLRKIENNQIIELIMTKIKEINEKFDIEKLLLQLSNCYLKEEEFINILINLPLNQWPVKLKHFDFIQSVHNAIHRSDLNDNSSFDNHFSSIIYYLYILKIKSEVLVNQLLEIFKNNQLAIEQVSEIIYKLYSGIWEFDEEMINKIRNSPKGTLENMNIGNGFLTRFWNYWSGDAERKSDKLIKIINKDKYTSIKDRLNQLEIFVQNVNNCKTIQINQKNESIQSLTIKQIQQWSIEFKARSKKNKISDLHESLAVIEKAITILYSEISSLRDAQKLTILSFISNSQNILAQVSTGEGKSLIVASIMIIKCLLGEKGDIITSSPILAERDANENEELFNAFDITVAHNSSESIIERRHAYEKHVVYGDLSSFQRDYLLDHFYGKNILGDRYENGRTNIIVDEVDSMLLDKGNSILYLSHQPPCLDTLEAVYVFIWQIIILNVTNGKHLTIYEIKNKVLQNLYPIFDKHELNKLTNNQEIIDLIWDELIDQDSIDEDGKILSLKVEFNDKDLQPFVKHIKYLLKEIFNYEKKIEVPNYLKPFIERHLLAWIQSAMTALDMEEGRNYIIDADKTATRLDKHPNIIIVDCDTGVDQINSQWNEGLHQFLQLKHQCKTSLLSLKAIFISNISFFNMYTHIYGLSGTLGSESEREFLKLTYNVDFLTVPVALSSRFKEDQPILCKDLTEWRKIIVEQSVTISRQRSVLIICETIKDVEQINQTFKLQTDFDSNNIFVYKRSYEKFSIEHDGLDIGNIIIATNLAGRGTDIKITDKLNNNGGLHVILTYLPENYRIEQQAFGRTARKGQNGSGQIIFIDQFSSEDQEIDSPLHVIDLKNERDYNELCRVGEIRRYYETSIQFEEQLFRRYHKAYDFFKEKLQRTWKTHDDIQDIILHSILNKWAFWLDEISTIMTNNKIEVVELLEEFINQLDQIKTLDNAIKELVIEPSQLIKLAKCYMNKAKYDQANQILDQVIDNEPQFSHAAYYYKAHCTVKRTALETDENKIDFHRSLDHAELLFQHHIDKLTERNAIINKLSQSKMSFVTIESYRVQNENLCNLYSNFIRSIHDIRGHQVTPETFLSIDINHELAMTIYNKFLDRNVNILINEFNGNFNEKGFKIICDDYQLNYEHVRSYLHKNKIIDEKLLRHDFESLPMSNRKHFWKLMMEQKMITNEKHFIIINTKETDEKLTELINSLRNELKPIDEIKPKDKSIIFFEKVPFDTENIKFAYKTLNEKYQILEKQKLILSNKMATIDEDKLQKIPIGQFQAITLNHLQIEELDINDSKIIYDKLVKQNIIDRATGILLTDNFFKLKLDEYQIYEQSIIAIINCNCLYKRQILNMLYQMNSKDFDIINLSLPYNLYTEFLYDLRSALIIKPVYYNYKKIDVSLFEKVCLKDYSSKLEKEIQKVCCTQTNIAKSIATSLQNTIGKLNFLSKPNSCLNDIEKYFINDEKFEHIKELDIFRINGFDHLISIEETKWSWQMIRNTTFIILFGIAQIIGGVFLELYTMGANTFIATGLISEGINDIIYGFSAVKSGHFNWNDYHVHKIHSIMFTVGTMGIGACIGRGIRYSRFGTKLVGNTGFLSKLCGTKLITAASQSSMEGVSNSLMKKVWCRIGVKLAQGLAIAGVNAGISYISDRIFKGYCGKIVDALFLNIRKSINDKKEQIKKSLKEIYLRYGKSLTEKWLTDSNQSINSAEWYEKTFHLIRQIVYLISGGISTGLRKMNSVGYSNNFTKIALSVTGACSTIMKSAAYVGAISKICFETDIFINDKIKKLEEKAKECKTKDVSISANIDESDFNQFLEETTERWSKTLETKVDTDVRTKLIEPILCEGANTLLRKLGKAIQNYHQRDKDKILWKKFQSNKDEYEKQKSSIEQQEDNINTEEVLTKITKEYNHTLLVIAANTRDPDLVATIVEEDGPMDMVSIQALSNIIGQPIKIKNADGTTFPDLITPQGVKIDNNENENSKSIEFTPGDGINTFGHFSSSEQANEDSNTNNDNNCLIYAVMQPNGLDINSIDANDVRKKIANEIRTNAYINNIIQNGYHCYYISQLGFGGQRPTFKKKHVRLDDGRSEESATTIENEEQTNTILHYDPQREINTIIQLKEKHFKAAVIKAKENNQVVKWNDTETKVTLKQIRITDMIPERDNQGNIVSDENGKILYLKSNRYTADIVVILGRNGMPVHLQKVTRLGTRPSSRTNLNANPQ